MKLFDIKFIQSISRTDTVTSFRFEKPLGLEFKAGQFAQLLFDDKDPGNKSCNKFLSFSCSPDKQYIEFTKRLSTSEFSDKLSSLAKGDVIKLKASMGHCVFDDKYDKIAFLVGGIGVTPVISIMEYVYENNISMDIAMLYSNRCLGEIAFKDMLDNYSTRDNINVCYTLDDLQGCDETHLEGFIDSDKLKNCIPDYLNRHIYVFGPPAMVNSICNLCISEGVDEKNLSKENFLGY